MKKIVLTIVTAFALCLAFTGCTAADTASQQVSAKADNFEVVRELTVFDNVTGEILFVAQGRMSITVDSEDQQLEIMVAQPGDIYEKHYVGLNETTTYVVRDLQGVDVENFRYKLTINPDMLIPFEFMVADGGGEL